MTVPASAPASRRLQEMLDRGMDMTPDLLRTGPDDAPDLEGYLKSVDLLISCSVNMMKLRKAEMEMGPLQEPGSVTVDQAMTALLSTPVSPRKALVERLQRSLSPKGMKT